MPDRPRPIRRTALAGALLLACLPPLLSSEAGARPSQRRYQLVWLRDGVGESCPAPGQIREQIRRWLGREPFAEDAPEVIEVTIGMHEDRFRAIVRTRDERGRARGERFFDGPGTDCSSMARAATLAVVLILDPDAPPVPPLAPSSAPLAPSSTPPVASSTPPVASSTPPVASSTPPVAAPLLPVSAPVPLASVAPRSSAAPSSSPETALSAGSTGSQGAVALQGGGLSGLLPSAGVVVGVSTERQLSRGTWLRGRMLRSSTEPTADGAFAFSLTAGWLGPCVRLVGEEALGMHLCAELGAGLMTALVGRLEPLEVGDFFWLGGGLEAGVRVRLGRGWFIGGGAELLVPLRGSAFRVEGPAPREIFRPRTGGQLALELGLSFL